MYTIFEYFFHVGIEIEYIHVVTTTNEFDENLIIFLEKVSYAVDYLKKVSLFFDLQKRLRRCQSFL